MSDQNKDRKNSVLKRVLPFVQNRKFICALSLVVHPFVLFNYLCLFIGESKHSDALEYAKKCAFLYNYHTKKI